MPETRRIFLVRPEVLPVDGTASCAGPLGSYVQAFFDRSRSVEGAPLRSEEGALAELASVLERRAIECRFIDRKEIGDFETRNLDQHRPCVGLEFRGHEHSRHIWEVGPRLRRLFPDCCLFVFGAGVADAPVAALRGFDFADAVLPMTTVSADRSDEFRLIETVGLRFISSPDGRFERIFDICCRAGGLEAGHAVAPARTVFLTEFPQATNGFTHAAKSPGQVIDDVLSRSPGPLIIGGLRRPRLSEAELAETFRALAERLGRRSGYRFYTDLSAPYLVDDILQSLSHLVCEIVRVYVDFDERNVCNVHEGRAHLVRRYGHAPECISDIVEIDSSVSQIRERYRAVTKLGLFGPKTPFFVLNGLEYFPKNALDALGGTYYMIGKSRQYDWETLAKDFLPSRLSVFWIAARRFATELHEKYTNQLPVLLDMARQARSGSPMKTLLTWRRGCYDMFHEGLEDLLGRLEKTEEPSAAEEYEHLAARVATYDEATLGCTFEATAAEIIRSYERRNGTPADT